MKTLKNNPISYSKGSGTALVEVRDYAHAIQFLIDCPPSEKGFSRADMNTANAIESKIKGIPSVIELEDAEAEYLKNIDNVYPWAIRSLELAQFRKDLHAL